MLEAELFGFEAGAFTDAKRSKPGLFEAASGGTLFLDEVDSLSPPVQSKVLKAIEEKRVRRLGAVEARAMDVKLVAATQRDLPALVASGAFRADLYHRLAVLVLAIPPLRERAGDALALAEHFLATYAAAHGVPSKRLTDDGRAWLTQHPWPGNVRELSHLLERVMLLATDDTIGADTLRGLALVPAPAAGTPTASTAVAPPRTARATGPDQAAGDDEAQRIEAALARAGGNVVRAARALGLGRNALRYRMRRLGIERSVVDDAAYEPPAAAPAPRRAEAVAEPSVWEQKPVAVLALSLTFTVDPQTAGYEPWTTARHWQRAIAERVAGFGGVFVQTTASRALRDLRRAARAGAGPAAGRAGGAERLPRRRRRGGERRRRSAPRCTSARCASTAQPSTPRQSSFRSATSSRSPNGCSVTPALARCWCRRRRRGAPSAISCSSSASCSSARGSAIASLPTPSRSARRGIAADRRRRSSSAAAASSISSSMRSTAPPAARGASCSSPAKPASASRACSPSCACASPTSRITGSRAAAPRTARPRRSCR